LTNEIAIRQLDAARPMHTKMWFLLFKTSMLKASTKTVLAGNMFRLTATNSAITMIAFPKLMMSVVIEAMHTGAISNLSECSLSKMYAKRPIIPYTESKIK
jgi:hypothetical protein